jgi:amidase
MSTVPKTQFSGPDLCKMSAHEVVAFLKAKKVSPAELLDACFARIEAVEPQVNAMPTICKDRAYAALSAVEGASMLAGVPMGIKDLTEVEGVRTTMGTLGLADQIPTKSDPLVTRLEANGGIVVGKTNTPEFGAGGNTFNAVFGRTRNPWDVSKNAGGSSGGAAASLASGEVWLSHGSDLAGSVRTPAAYCSIVGLRPSPGRAGGGPGPMKFHTEGVQGPMARNVRDCALFMDAMSGFDPASPISFPQPSQSFFETTQRPAKGYRIGYSATLNGFGTISPQIDAILRGALDRLAKNGAEVEDHCPDLNGLDQTYRVLRAMLWAALPGRAPEALTQHYKATLKGNISVGQNLTINDVYDMQLTRSAIYDSMIRFFDTYDVLACPVVGIEAGPVEEEYPIIGSPGPDADYLDWLRYSFLSTTTGLPAMSVPVGFTKDGMPVGLQIIGKPRGETELFQIARAIEIEMGGPFGPIDPITK